MNIIRIKKLNGDFYHDYCVELIKNQKVINIDYVKGAKFVFDILLLNIIGFKEIELRCFLNEFKRSKKIYRHQINLFVKSKYKTIYPYFKSVVDYGYLERIITTTLNNLKVNDRMSVKF